MVQALDRKEINDAAMHPGFQVAGTIDQTGNARLQDGAATHRARLESHEQFAAGQTIVAQIARGVAQGGYLGVRCWIVVADRRIEATADDHAIPHDQRTHRHFAEALGSPRQRKSFAHEVFVVHRCHFTAACWRAVGQEYRGCPFGAPETTMRPCPVPTRPAEIVMRILFVHQNFPGQYRHLAPALAASLENEVVAIGEEASIRRVPGFHPRIRLLAYAQPQGASRQTHHYLHSTEAAVRRGQAVLRLAMALRRQGFVPDVICAHPGWGEALFLKDVYPAARLLLYLEFLYRGSGSDMGFDPEFPTSFDDRCRVRIRNATQLISLEAAAAGISPTRWQRDQYPRQFHDQIQVIHDGIRTALVCPGPVADFTLPDGRGSLRSGDEVITYAARNLEPYRGFHTFMRALPMVLAARPQAQVLIVGGDEVSYGRSLPAGETYRETYLREVAALIDGSRVHFLGKVPYARFLDALRLSSVHVYLTYPFVLSWSLLEAMSCGCLILASDTAPVREVVTAGRNGLLVDFFAHAALAEKIVAVLADPEPTKALRVQARLDMLEEFDLERRTLPRLLAAVKDLALQTPS